MLSYFWTLDDNLKLRVRRDHLPYDVWEKQGFIKTTEGNVVHYGFIESFIEELNTKYNIKELMKLTVEKRIAHGGNSLLRWMMNNIFIKQDPAGNINPDKEKSTEKIDGAVALIMVLYRAIRN